jgi:hypothetical protein
MDGTPEEPAEFSLRGYASLLEIGHSAGYKFVTFRDVAGGAEGRLCLLRHDVDVNVGYALEMARAEAGAGVTSTYFVMLRSPAYNLMSRAASVALREIVALGHEVGVHFDAQHPLLAGADLVDSVLEEARIIEGLAGARIHAVSFHQPSERILKSAITVPGLINTYNRDQLAGWHYISDSNRKWKAETAWQLLRDASIEKIQILIHPMWWVCTGPTTEAVWDKAVEDNFRTMQEQLLATETAYGPPRSLKVVR